MDVDAAARPRFKSSIRTFVAADEGIFILSEGGNAWMPDAIYAAVAPMLDGAHEIEAIFQSLSDAYPAAHVFAALSRLRTGGYLAGDVAEEAAPAMAFWEQAGVAPALARSRLDVALVSMVWLGGIDTGPLEDLPTPSSQARAKAISRSS
jgi:hypothetical protein